MTKKIALFALAIASAAQADSSCDVTSRLYGGFGLGFSNAHAPLLKHKEFIRDILNEHLEEILNSVDLSKADITTSYKKMRGLATRLALGGHFLVPNTCLVLGAEMSLGLGGSKGQIKQNLDKTKVADAVDAVPAVARRRGRPGVPGRDAVGGRLGRPDRAAVPAVPAVAAVPGRDAVAAVPENNASGSYVCKIRDRWNVAFTGIVGAKVGRILPYAKVGVAIHAFKTTEELSINGPTKSRSESTITKSKRPLFVMGLGAEYNVTKNSIVGAEWTHGRGTLGLLNKEAKKDPTKQDKKMNKIRINDFMVTCKYAFPVSH